MKLFLLMPFLILFHLTSNATDYFFSTSGNDANNGTSSSTPWRTISKFNSVFSSLKPGDRVLFNRGNTFYGGMTISRSGASGASIVIGAYGSGANPIISGFTNVSSWVNVGGNIWESTSAISSLTATNMVVINGQNTPMGRYPNSGYLIYQSYVGKTSITSNQLSSSPNWTGAEAVIRKQNWIIDRNKITSHSGGTLYYTATSNNNGKNNYGFFIQNDSKTLDISGEWYYNPSTRKIRIYSSGSPINVKVATVDILVNMVRRNYITFENITFQGSNNSTFSIQSSSNVTIQNCAIEYSGRDAIWGAKNGGMTSTNFKLLNSTIIETNNNAITLENEFSNALISNNTITNTGMDAGMGANGSGNYGTHTGIQVIANSPIIEYNTIKNTGFNAICANGNNSIVRNNFIDDFCNVKHDGSGIYSVVGLGGTAYTGIKFLNNIILNGIGSNAGTSGTTRTPNAHGIYIDDWSANIEVTGNSIANCSHSGLYLHNAYNINIQNNTSFNNSGFQLLLASFDVNKPVRNDIIKNNIFVAKQSNQSAASFESKYSDFASFGTIDYNYYARPINNNGLIKVAANSYSLNYVYTLPQWISYSGQDKNSKLASKTVTNVNDIRFVYNASKSSKSITLDGNYIDVKNGSYNGSITLAPYTSAVLIRNGPATNTPPVANAGSDKSIILPTNIITLSGTGTDAGGSISNYNWTKVSGPSSGSISNTSSASTSVTGLVQGIYEFQLKVTDNLGASDLDNVRVTVNSSTGNIAPVANAGNDQTITLPASTATLSGSGTDSDGSISSYNWSKIAGPSSGSISNPNSASTALSGLVQGNYEFQLRVTDNDGATGFSTLLVNVNAAGALLPAVNPGSTVGGLDYKYYEASSYSLVPDFSKVTPIKSGTISKFDNSIANRAEIFAIQFSGYISVPVDGQYTFYTLSDDGSNLYIDGIKVVNNDGRHWNREISGTIGLKAGKHAISVGYFQQTGGKLLDVSYSGPGGISKQIIPASALYRVVNDGLLPAVNPGNTVNGLEYNYYEAGSYSLVPDFSKVTPIKSGTVSKFDNSIANRAEVFAIQFKGFINVPSDGQYTFYTLSDDGSNLFIDGIKVVDNDGRHWNREISGTIGLKAGKHAISVGYFQQTGGRLLDVSYSGAGISKQIIPASALFRVMDDELLPAVNPGNVINGIDYKYYEGTGYSVVPNYSLLSPKKTGSTTNFNLALSDRTMVFSFNFTGYVSVPADGQYTFYTNSDDGSNLFIDNIRVVNNDGLHGSVERSGTIGLKAGKHAISVGYIQQGGGSVLSVYYSGPGVSKKLIPSSSLFRQTNSLSLIGDKSMSLTPGNNDGLNTMVNETTGPQLDIFELKAYPNPFINSVNLTINGKAGKVKILLLDAAGRIIYRKEDEKYIGRYNHIINSTQWVPGIYFLKVYYGDKTKVIKILKNNPE